MGLDAIIFAFSNFLEIFCFFFVVVVVCLNIFDLQLVVSKDDYIFWGASKITADGECSHEIKRCLLLGRKLMTHLEAY